MKLLANNSKEIKVELKWWKKGIKIGCPYCKRLIGKPYECECGHVLKPYVKVITK